MQIEVYNSEAEYNEGLKLHVKCNEVHVLEDGLLDDYMVYRILREFAYLVELTLGILLFNSPM